MREVLVGILLGDVGVKNVGGDVLGDVNLVV